MLPPVRIEPGPLMNLWFNTLLSELSGHVLLMGSLNFCSCITWFLDLDYLVRINRAQPQKDPEVSALLANAQLAKKGEWWTWNQRFMRGPGSIPTGGHILSLDFMFSHSKVSDANIGIIAHVVCLWKIQVCNIILFWVSDADPGFLTREETNPLKGSSLQHWHHSHVFSGKM